MPPPLGSYLSKIMDSCWNLEARWYQHAAFGWCHDIWCFLQPEIQREPHKNGFDLHDVGIWFLAMSRCFDSFQDCTSPIWLTIKHINHYSQFIIRYESWLVPTLDPHTLPCWILSLFPELDDEILYRTPLLLYIFDSIWYWFRLGNSIMSYGFLRIFPTKTKPFWSP